MLFTVKLHSTGSPHGDGVLFKKADVEYPSERSWIVFQDFHCQVSDNPLAAHFEDGIIIGGHKFQRQIYSFSEGLHLGIQFTLI
jgi:hypothetical protein